MDDFLYNIRYGNNRRFEQSRKLHDNPQYRSQDKQYQTKDKKSGNYRKARQVDQGNAVSGNIEALVSAQNRLAAAEERKAEALEEIAGYIKDFVSMPVSPISNGRLLSQSANSGAENPRSASRAIIRKLRKTSSSRIKVIANIHKLRLEGLSYEKIAHRLQDEKVTTLSGSGKWYPATVSRLYQEFEESYIEDTLTGKEI